MELATQTLWRVGRRRAPLAFPPRDRYGWSHRFDDLERRWRTIYCAWTPEAALREVLADLRPNVATIARFIAAYGRDAAEELPRDPITASWRRQNVLAPVHIVVEDGARVLDLTDAHECRRLEEIHAPLLHEHGLGRLDLHEITTRRRAVTRAVATRAYDEEHVGVVRYPSSVDLSATPCYALIEGRARLERAGDPVRLTDPPPRALENVAAGWKIPLASAPPLSTPRARRPSTRTRS